MKVAALSLALTLCLVLSAEADFTIVQKVEQKGTSNEITLKLKGDRIRIDAAAGVTMIVDGKSGDTLTLMKAQKKFLRISGEKARAIAELATKYGGTSGTDKPKLVATGKKMTINGYEAEEYLGETKLFKARYWIATSFPDSAAIMKQLQEGIPAALNELGKGMMDYRDLPGFPLRTQITMGEEEIVSTLVSVKHDALSDADFVPPKDYQEMAMPNVDSLSRPKPEPAASAKP
jgi:hypothetical protein